jgi:hypothetical protein
LRKQIHQEIGGCVELYLEIDVFILAVFNFTHTGCSMAIGIQPVSLGGNMQHARRFIQIIFVLTAIVAIVGCSPTAAPAQPTPDQQIVEQTVEAVKTQAAETVVAELTLMVPLPTETPLPSPTPLPPTEEPTPLPPPPTATLAPVILPTATFIPLPTSTATPSAFACTVVSQSPASGAAFKVNEDFDLAVTIKNTGTQDWHMQIVDFFYVSGTKLQTFVDIIDMPDHVPSGKEVKLLIDMTAPDKAGTYTAVWAVGEGSTKYCSVNINIKVNE